MGVLARVVQLMGDADSNGISDTALRDQLNSHLVRIAAAALTTGENLAEFKRLDGLQRLLRLLPAARMDEVKTSAHAAAVSAAKIRQEANANLIGNAATLITKCVSSTVGLSSLDSSNACKVVKWGGVEQLITVLRDAKNAAVRKNVAICLATLSRDPTAKEKIRS